MDVTQVLLDILIVLVAAKLAAEVSERIGLPAVVGEILAGIVIGPSLLGLVGGDDEVLRTLGELGVILLLLEVGLEMDLRELGAVGRASLATAVVGVVCPMVGGIGAMQLLGSDFETALFVGAALTATSVGITARVFGDLRALATTEARIVLGAAVADDVMGLVVLTVVVRLVTGGSVSVLGVAWILVVAVGFLVVGGLAGLKVAPPLFARVERSARSSGTLVALALAFTLAFAELADVAKLAPIVGAFVAGLALGRTGQSERIRRELAPVGHLFIPVFFLQIGIDADSEAFLRLSVLRDAAVLLVVAVVGKLIAAVGCIGTGADKPLVGLGMLPRGEVGLIFATIGLANGVLDEDLYAALLLVVLITTLVTPPLLKFRSTRRERSTQAAAPVPAQPPPPGGYLAVVDGRVELAAVPPAHLGLALSLRAAALIAHARPSGELVDWMATLGDDQLRWRAEGAPAFFDVVENGNARSWRFLDTTGVLERVLPELAAAVRARQVDPFEIDPATTHHFWLVDQLRQADGPAAAGEREAEAARLRHRPWLLLAGLLIEALGDRQDAVAATRQIMRRLDLGAAAEQEVTALVADRELLWTAVRQPEALAEGPVLALAGHLEDAERARALYLLSLALSPDASPRRRERLRLLHERLQYALARSELTGLDVRNALSRRRAEARRLVGSDAAAVERIDSASVAYLLAVDAVAVARQVRSLTLAVQGRAGDGPDEHVGVGLVGGGGGPSSRSAPGQRPVARPARPRVGRGGPRHLARRRPAGLLAGPGTGRLGRAAAAQRWGPGCPPRRPRGTGGRRSVAGRSAGGRGGGRGHQPVVDPAGGAVVGRRSRRPGRPPRAVGPVARRRHRRRRRTPG